MGKLIAGETIKKECRFCKAYMFIFYIRKNQDVEYYKCRHPEINKTFKDKKMMLCEGKYWEENPCYPFPYPALELKLDNLKVEYCYNNIGAGI